MPLPTAAIAAPTWRLIPSRFPPVATFDNVASADDLQAVMELEGWTNDRLVAERAGRLPREQWVYGTLNASMVMASFLHVADTGMRFNSGQLGAWYAGLALKTSIAEVAHHLRREAIFRRLTEMRISIAATPPGLPETTTTSEQRERRGPNFTRLTTTRLPRPSVKMSAWLEARASYMTACGIRVERMWWRSAPAASSM